MRRLVVPALASTLMLAGSFSPAAAQDVEYTTVGKVELSGALGTVMRLFGGGDETTEKTYIKGGMMRTDSDRMSTIMDLENGRVISIDHDAKTFTIMTFAQMTQMMEQAVTDAKAEAARESGEPAPESDTDVDLDYRLSVDETGERQKINGYDAERYLMTMETEATVTEEGGEAQKAGRLVVFSDMWNAEDVPVADAMAAFYRDAPELAARNQQAMQGMAGAFAANPDLESAMEEASKEAGKMKGFTLRNTTYMVLVPPGVEFDRAAVLEPKKKEESGAKRALGGLLRGAVGGNREQEKAESEPGQAVVATILNETRDMKSTSLSADLFQPPAGYTEKPMRLPGS